jgi:hypothetical protein
MYRTFKGPTFCLQHADAVPNHGNHTPVLRIRIRRMRMFLGLPNPHPLVTSKNPAPEPVPVPAPDPSFNHQAKIVRKTLIYTVL